MIRHIRNGMIYRKDPNSYIIEKLGDPLRYLSVIRQTDKKTEDQGGAVAAPGPEPGGSRIGLVNELRCFGLLCTPCLSTFQSPNCTTG